MSGTWNQEVKQNTWRNAAYWFAMLIFHSGPRSNITNSGLNPHISIVTQENGPTEQLTNNLFVVMTQVTISLL